MKSLQKAEECSEPKRASTIKLCCEYTYRYINADLKISLYVCVHVKIMLSKFRILNPNNSWVCIFPKKYGTF